MLTENARCPHRFSPYPFFTNELSAFWSTTAQMRILHIFKNVFGYIRIDIVLNCNLVVLKLLGFSLPRIGKNIVFDDWLIVVSITS
ncbi:hypothetical protein I7I48_03650 [Histoplasma ohiense]|nr:hypothetical protein I7I48_03650 [Histoplasma ohiense (nom. inval.)]